MRRAIILIALLGFCAFAGGLAISYADPLRIESTARELLRIEVEKRVGERIDALSESRIAALAARTLAKTDADIERTRQALRADVPAKVANVLADMLRADCECRQRLVEYMRESERLQLASLTELQPRLTRVIEATYASVSAKLIREFRIFCLSNAIAFALLVLTAFVRKNAGVHLVLPAAVLLGAVLITGGFYLFNQDWLHTIVFGEYVGWGYAVYLAVVALLLNDVMFNRARVTARILNAAFRSISMGPPVLPC